MNSEEIAQDMSFTHSQTEMTNESAMKDFTSTPIVILIYYDDFRKYRLAHGSAGGLYFTILNLRRRAISKPSNIFAVTLVKSKNDAFRVFCSPKGKGESASVLLSCTRRYAAGVLDMTIILILGL